MKKHAIIPIFIPHIGCPKNCVFCDQKTITSRDSDVTFSDARNIIEEWLTTLDDIETKEISFYGGSFTGIDVKLQEGFLSIAKEYKDKGLVDKIHLSTRPDYISNVVLDRLKKYSVDVIELGVQSFDEEVILASGRGHSISDIYNACDLIKSYGFELGIQLMIGLPKDSFDKAIYSAKETVKIKPSIARIYPTVTIKGTELYRMYEEGIFKPLSLDEQIKYGKEMYRILTSNNINVIRMGLKSSEVMNNEIGFHPAYSSLVKSSLARDIIEEKIKSNLITVKANSKSYSNIFGQNQMNKKYFKEKYPDLIITGEIDNSLEDDKYVVINGGN